MSDNSPTNIDSTNYLPIKTEEGDIGSSFWVGDFLCNLGSHPPFQNLSRGASGSGLSLNSQGAILNIEYI
jgi:hypothetical protein